MSLSYNSYLTGSVALAEEVDDPATVLKHTIYQCSLVQGDGVGGTEVKIGKQTGAACMTACLKRRHTDKSINGITLFGNDKPGCWCEKGMKKVGGRKIYKTCFLKPSKGLILVLT